MAVVMVLLSLLLVLSSAAVQAQADSSNCSYSQWSFEEFSEKLKIIDECVNSSTQWTESQNAAILNDLNRLVDIFKKNTKLVCKEATPKNCPAPAVHSKGGLVCVSSDARRYCKPMCNEGFDFSFLRISRLYEECSDATSYKWTTQYVGGNRLAVCVKSTHPIAGASSAYFPKDQDCVMTKSDSALEETIFTKFENELKAANIKGPYTDHCLVCG